MTRLVGLALLFVACAPVHPEDAGSADSHVERKKTAYACVDKPLHGSTPDPDALKILMEGIAQLGECVEPDASPVNVLVRAAFRPDGTVAAVGIARTSARDCEALECVRRRLAQMKAPATSRSGVRMVGADFVLRRSPAPDGNEKVRWNSWAHSTVCTDEYMAVDPHIKPEIMRETIRSRREHFRACYRAGLRLNPSLRGRVGVKLDIAVDGAVSNVDVVANELPDCEVVACIKAEFQALRFPASEKESSAFYSLNLVPD